MALPLGSTGTARLLDTGTETLSSSDLFYLSLKSKDVTLGIMGVNLSMPDRPLLPEPRRSLEPLSSIVAMAFSDTSPMLVLIPNLENASHFTHL